MSFRATDLLLVFHSFVTYSRQKTETWVEFVGAVKLAVYLLCSDITLLRRSYRWCCHACYFAENAILCALGFHPHTCGALRVEAAN